MAFTGIYLDGQVDDTRIRGNTIYAVGTPAFSNGIVVGGSGRLVTISENRVVSANTAVWLQPSSHSMRVMDNTLNGSPSGVVVLDQGYNNYLWGNVKY